MQENLKQEKRTKALYIIAICLLLVLFTASVFLAVIAPVFISNGVASALDVTLSDTGIVGENLLKHTDMSTWDFNLSGSTRVNLFKDDSVYLSSSGSNSYTLVSSTLSSTIKSTGGKFANLRFRLYDSSISGAYTFTSYASSVVGNFGMQCWGYNSSGQPTNIGSAHFNLSSGINSFTYNLDGSYSYYLFIVQTYDEVTLDWVKVEKGSSFTGYVPDYQTQINNLQNELNQANQEKQELQDNYDKLSESLQFSVLSSLSLSNTVMYRSATQQNLFSSARQISVNNVSYPGYYYFFDGGTNNNSNRKYLFKWELDSTVPSGNDVKFYADFVTFWDGVGVVPGDNYYLGVYYSYADFDSYNREFNSGWIYYPLSDLNKFYSDSRFFSFDVNAVYFDLFQLDQGVYVSVPLQSSVTNKDGLFLSGFSLLMRSNSVDSLVDSARQDGYNSGYHSGKSAGYNEGYSKGLEDSGNYSFMGLLGAVFDAPIQAFKGLLSFEVLGVNMSSFVSSLFGLAVILLILKLILGGGK